MLEAVMMMQPMMPMTTPGRLSCARSSARLFEARMLHSFVYPLPLMRSRVTANAL